MKRGKDEDKMMGPMFPRLHVNDTEKGGPRAPPRNKMALYEQLSIPSQRFSHSMLPYNTPANSMPHSSQVGGNDRDTFLYSQVPPRHQSSEQLYKQYSDMSTPLAQVEHRNKSDEDECRVPVFIHAIPSKQFDKYSTDMDREKLSPSGHPYFHQSSSVQKNRSQKTQAHYSIDRLKTDGPVHCSEDQNIVHDLSCDAGSGDDESFRPLEAGLEKGDSVSETSVLDAINGVNITPDDVVGVIGQKQFFQARTAIANQQRAFAVQVFELHRLIKVQKLIAASPHLLLENSPYFSKPIKASSPAKKLPSDHTVKSIPNIPKRQCIDSEKPIQDKEGSAENTVEKASLPSPGNPCCNQQPQGHQWLIPVMSPSEGLVYKPYPFISQPCGGGCGPPVSSSIPPPPQQYHHLPSFPPFTPHGYFPPYVVPIMDTSAFSGSQPTAAAGPQNNRTVREVEMQGSTASSQSGARHCRRASGALEERNMLPLFPTSPADYIDDSNVGPARPARVIKVVPRNGLSASESAARIFRSIQEERKQYDSV